jgi:hypothetical protein
MHNTVLEKETGVLTYSQSTSTPNPFCLHNSKGANEIRYIFDNGRKLIDPIEKDKMK